MELLLVGVLARAHGLKGEFTVIPHNPESPLWVKGRTFHLLAPEQVIPDRDVVEVADARQLALKALRRVPDDRLLCAFDAIVDRTAAEGLEGHHLAVPLSDVPETRGDEIYHRELRGFSVSDRAGTLLGSVVGVFPGPAQDLVEVQPPFTGRGKRPDTWFVPFVEAFIVEVDRDRRQLVIDTPEGLVP